MATNCCRKWLTEWGHVSIPPRWGSLTFSTGNQDVTQGDLKSALSEADCINCWLRVYSTSSVLSYFSDEICYKYSHYIYPIGCTPPTLESITTESLGRGCHFTNGSKGNDRVLSKVMVFCDLCFERSKRKVEKKKQKRGSYRGGLGRRQWWPRLWN